MNNNYVQNSVGNINNNVIQLDELKSEIVNFDKTNSIDEETILLGELLNYLRKNKFMGLLMICRDIIKLSINGKVVEFEFDKEQEKNLFSNAGYVQIIKDFFSTKNLDIKCKQKIIVETDVDKLNNLLGGQLMIKNGNN